MEKIKKALTSAKNTVVEHRATVAVVTTTGVFSYVLLAYMAGSIELERSHDAFLADKDLLSEFHKYRHPAKD